MWVFGWVHTSSPWNKHNLGGSQNPSSASSEVISSKKPWSIWDFPGSQLGNTANLRCQHDGLSKVLEKTGKPSHSRECEGHISHLITWRWTSQTQKLLGRGWYVIVSHQDCNFQEFRLMLDALLFSAVLLFIFACWDSPWDFLKAHFFGLIKTTFPSHLSSDDFGGTLTAMGSIEVLVPLPHHWNHGVSPLGGSSHDLYVVKWWGNHPPIYKPLNFGHLEGNTTPWNWGTYDHQGLFIA